MTTWRDLVALLTAAMNFPFMEIFVAIVSGFSAEKSWREWIYADATWKDAESDHHVDKSFVEALKWRSSRERRRSIKLLCILISTVIVLGWRGGHPHETVSAVVYFTRNVTLLVLTLLLVGDMQMDRRTRREVSIRYWLERRQHEDPKAAQTLGRRRSDDPQAETKP